VIIVIIDIIVLFEIIAIIVLIEVLKRYAVFLTTFGWTNVLQLLKRLMTLVISSVRPCERDGWLTSRRPIMMLFSMVLRLDRENWLWEMMSDCL
jgi:hypothetical protein